jgi:glycosyltransferase involved in cell wall biosynthesis
MRVSIVTNSFNQGRFLEKAIQSVLGQGYPELEYIVVDPGSRDDSREIIRKYSGRINRVILDPDEGPADGLNKAFAAATGSIFGYLNSDDVLLPNAVRHAIESLERNPTADAIYSDGVMIDQDGRHIRRILSTPWDVVGYAYGACLTFQPGAFYRRDAFCRVGGFNIQNRTCWDAEILVDITLTGGNVIYLPGCVAAFRIHSDSITGSGRLRSDYKKDSARIREKVFHSLGVRGTRVGAMLYMLRRYFTRPETIFERLVAMVRLRG